MSIREIPRSFEYKCDRCDETHIQRNAGGHYTQSTPPGWLTIKYWRAEIEGLDKDAGDTHRAQAVLFCILCRKRFDQFWIAEMNQ